MKREFQKSEPDLFDLAGLLARNNAKLPARMGSCSFKECSE